MFMLAGAVARLARDENDLLVGGNQRCRSEREGDGEQKIFHRMMDALVSVHFNTFRKNFKPFTAISSRVGSMRRQMAAARAMTFTSGVNDSITKSPS